MKKIILLLLLFIGAIVNAQIKLNTDINIFQLDYPIEDNQLAINYETRLLELGYNDVKLINNTIYAKSFFTKLILGSAMEIHYTVKIDENKILLSNFKINDARYGAIALEEIRKNAQNKWIKEIDSRTPEIISRLVQ